MPRLRFSVRKLLLAVALLGGLLALTLHFAPHVLWKWHRLDSNAVVPHPHKSLVDVTPDEELACCRVGPVSVELPASMCTNLRVQRGIGGVFLCFDDAQRSIALQLPHPAGTVLTSQEAAAFPDKAALTFPRLHREIAEASSDDFSFGMSKRELAWHAWLISRRSFLVKDDSPYEYLWRPDLDGVLVRLSTTNWTFQWETIDHEWEGMTTYKSSSPDDVDWIRHACTTFSIDGDPTELQEVDDATLHKLLQITDVAGS
jgi:hypothetical protein